jgi:hypothetical protein
MAVDQLSWWTVFIGGLGLGSAVTSAISSLVQYVLRRRGKLDERRFVERKAAFLELLARIADLDRYPDDAPAETLIRYAHAVARVELVGSQKLRGLLWGWQDAPRNSQERIDAVGKMIAQMRSDLGITE